MINNKHQDSSQQGIIAIIITVVLMTLITMVTLSFSLIIRREQRQTIDRQLNSQAYYAAESAVNSVLAAIDSGIVSVDDIKGTTCNGSDPASSISKLISLVPSFATAIPTTGNTKVTCLTIKGNGSILTYDSMPVDVSQVVHLSTATPIGQVDISWQSNIAGSPLFPAPIGDATFPALNNWDSHYPAVLKVELVPWNAAGGNNSASLYNASEVYFLYPVTSLLSPSAVSDPAVDRKGQIVKASCNIANTPKYCKATIKGLAGSDYYLRIQPIYRSASVTVGTKDIGGTAVKLSEGQITIDATASSAGILKRIGVRRSSSSGASKIIPEFSIDSSSNICKRDFVSVSFVFDTCP